jgi:Spy/CpxP family protein refolding chaperone
MKKILLLMILATAVHTGYAQDSVRTKGKIRPNADLKLNEKQSQALQDINKSYMQGTQEVRKNRDLSKEQQKAKLDALQAERSGKIKEVLDAEQYAKWQQNREQATARADHYKHRDGKKGKRIHEVPVKELGLTDSQGEELKAINKEYMTKAMALKGLDKDEKRSKMKALKDERQQKIKSTLGDDNYSKYEAWEKERMKGFRDGMKERKKKAPATNQ